MVTKSSSESSTLPPIMNSAELCAYLKIHRSTLYRLLKTGEIPSFQVGGDYRFKRDAIDEWRKLQEQEGGRHPARTR